MLRLSTRRLEVCISTPSCVRSRPSERARNASSVLLLHSNQVMQCTFQNTKKEKDPNAASRLKHCARRELLDDEAVVSFSACAVAGG